VAAVLILATEQEEPESSSPACAVPSGTAHALAPGAVATRCGLPAARLTTWPELTWPPPGMAAVDLCPACTAAE
jgi:hypothetical protein